MAFFLSVMCGWIWPSFGWVWPFLSGCGGFGWVWPVLVRCGWVWASVTFFWLGVDECDRFLAGCGWVWVSVTFFWLVWVSVGKCVWVWVIAWFITAPLKYKKNLHQLPQLSGYCTQNEYRRSYSGQYEKRYNNSHNKSTVIIYSKWAKSRCAILSRG